MFGKINLLDELNQERKNIPPAILLEEARKILDDHSRQDADILNRLAGNSGEALSKIFIGPEDPNLYYLPTIRTICIKYRLRFLQSKMFRKEFPYEAILAIRTFEEKHKVKVENFRIIAPAEAFSLEDRDKDPVLFADLGNGQYYLLHKWGNDLSGLRMFLTYPLRNVFTLINTLLTTAILLAFIVPTDWVIRYEKDPEIIFYYRMGFLVYAFIALFFTTIYLGLTFRKNFSVTEWKSRYFN